MKEPEGDEEALKAAREKIEELRAIIMSIPIRALGNCSGCPHKNKQEQAK